MISLWASGLLLLHLFRQYDSAVKMDWTGMKTAQSKVVSVAAVKCFLVPNGPSKGYVLNVPPQAEDNCMYTIQWLVQYSGSRF